MALTQASEEGLKISNAGTNGQFLQKQSGNTGGLTWADGASEGTEVKSTGVSGTSSYLRADGDGTSSWQTVSSVGGATGVDFDDNIKVIFGTGNDFELFHDGTHSYIKDVGTGDLYIQNGSDKSIVCKTDAGVELFYNDGKKAFTGSTGFNVDGNCDLVSDNNKLQCGADADLQIYHDGTNSNVINTTGDLYLQTGAAKGIYIRPNNGENGIILHPDGAVELYHDNVKKAYTYSNGLACTANLSMVDDGKVVFGSGNDLEIYHDPDINVIDSATGNLEIRHGAEKMIACAADGQVELYYDSVKKFETTSDGATIHGDFILDNPTHAGADIFFDASEKWMRFDDDIKI